MKKIFTFIVALLAIATSANAGTIIGNEDNSSTWWTAFSDYYTISEDGTYTLKFTNYSSKTKNYYNWLVVLTTDADRGATDYSEYFVLRCDNYGWGNNYADGTLSSYYVWDSFLSDMDGSSVVMTITRADNKITIHADITTAAGVTDYWENYEVTIADLPETIRFFLTTELGHIDLESAEWTSAATAISSVKAADEEADGAIYNIAGQRVSKDAKGLLIKNGKKILVK